MCFVLKHTIFLHEFVEDDFIQDNNKSSVIHFPMGNDAAATFIIYFTFKKKFKIRSNL